MDGTIKGIVLSKDEENDEGHVDMMRISFLNVVKDLKNRQYLRERVREYEEGLSICACVVLVPLKSSLWARPGAN